MSADDVAVLNRAADKLEKILAKVSPGPWAYNSYNWVASVPKMRAHEEWQDSIPDGHTLERRGLCKPCGPEWQRPAPDPTLGHGCKLYPDDYRMDAEVARVPPFAGDTAEGCHRWDAKYIEAMNPIVGHFLVALLRAEAGGLAATEKTPALLDAVAGQPLGTELRVSYSTVPQLVAVARAILDETVPTPEETSR